MNPPPRPSSHRAPHSYRNPSRSFRRGSLRFSDACAFRARLVGTGVLLLTLLACRTPSAAVGPATSGSAGGMTEAAPDPARVLAETRARVGELSTALEEIRGLRFKTHVNVEVQSPEDFTAFVRSEVDKVLPVELASRQSRTFQALGLLPDGYDLRAGMLDMVVSQAGAYYNPETATFYILMTGLPSSELDAMIVHELQHALQDQTFDLGEVQQQIRHNPNEDARSAMQFVLEGEATYVMLHHQARASGTPLHKLPEATQDMIFAMMRNIDRKTLVESMRTSLPKGASGASMRAAMDAVAGIPPFLFWSLYDPYMKGQYAIHRVHAMQGWNGVGLLYARPPASTEQLLHPEKLLDPVDAPTDVPLLEPGELLGEGWTLTWSNVLGEAGIASFFDQQLGRRHDTAAAGWDGDRYALYEDARGASLLVWRTVWDSQEDAAEFAALLENVSKKGTLGLGKQPRSRIVQAEKRVTLLVGPEDTLSPALQRLSSLP